MPIPQEPISCHNSHLESCQGHLYLEGSSIVSLSSVGPSPPPVFLLLFFCIGFRCAGIEVFSEDKHSRNNLDIQAVFLLFIEMLLLRILFFLHISFSFSPLFFRVSDSPFPQHFAIFPQIWPLIFFLVFRVSDVSILFIFEDLLISCRFNFLWRHHANFVLGHFPHYPCNSQEVH